MKKIKMFFAAATVLLATSISAAPSGPEKVAPKVRAAFEQNFVTAQNVSWEKTEDLYFAYFELNNRDVTAAYNESGELVGTSRVLTMEQVPLSVSLAIAEKYKGYTVAKNATEITYDGLTSYFVTIENNKQVLKLKCSANAEISVESKIKK
jgi:hypothetical protein